MAKNKLILGCEYRIKGEEYGNRVFVLLFHRKPDNRVSVGTRNGKWKLWVDSENLIYIDTEANKKLGEKAKQEREKSRVDFVPSKGNVLSETEKTAPQHVKLSPQGEFFIVHESEFPSFTDIHKFDSYILAYKWVVAARKKGMEYTIGFNLQKDIKDFLANQ